VNSPALNHSADLEIPLVAPGHQVRLVSLRLSKFRAAQFPVEQVSGAAAVSRPAKGTPGFCSLLWVGRLGGDLVRSTGPVHRLFRGPSTSPKGCGPALQPAISFGDLRRRGC